MLSDTAGRFIFGAGHSIQPGHHLRRIGAITADGDNPLRQSVLGVVRVMLNNQKAIALGFDVVVHARTPFVYLAGL